MMNQKVKKVVYLVLFLSFLGLQIPSESEAIPAFARKYGVQCTTCHVQFPRLNKFGIGFKNRGYRMKDEEGEFLWKSKIFPVAAIGRFGYVNEDKKTSAGTARKGEFEFDGLELFSGGTIGPRLSYFIDALTEDNLPLVQFDDILSDSRLNLKTGFYNVDNYFLSHPRRLTQTTYLVQTTADREDNVTFGNEGIELNGQFYDAGFRYLIGIGNASVSDDDHRFGRHIYGMVNQEFGDHTLSLMFRRDTAGQSSDNSPLTDDSDDTLTFGGVVDFNFGDLIVDVAGYFFDGSKPLNFTENGNTVEYEATSGTVEALYSFTPKLLGIARYDWHNTHDSDAEEWQWVVSMQYHFVPNVKLNFEYVNKDIDIGGNTNREEEQERQIKTFIRFGF